jgi:hypothetical protein
LQAAPAKKWANSRIGARDGLASKLAAGELRINRELKFLHSSQSDAAPTGGAEAGEITAAKDESGFSPANAGAACYFIYYITQISEF